MEAGLSARKRRIRSSFRDHFVRGGGTIAAQRSCEGATVGKRRGMPARAVKTATAATARSLLSRALYAVASSGYGPDNSRRSVIVCLELVFFKLVHTLAGTRVGLVTGRHRQEVAGAKATHLGLASSRLLVFRQQIGSWTVRLVTATSCSRASEGTASSQDTARGFAALT